MGSKQGDIAGGGESVRLTPRKQAASNPSTRLGLSTEGGGSEALYAGVANRADNRADKEEGGQEEDGAQATRAHLRGGCRCSSSSRSGAAASAAAAQRPSAPSLSAALFCPKKGQRRKKGHVESLENQFPDLL